MAHVLEKLQIRALELEKQIKEKYKKEGSGIKFAKQLINGAKDAVNYSYQTDRDEKWYVEYGRELEKRL